MKPKDFELLIDALKSLPSISTKSAEKIASYILHCPQDIYDGFVDRLIKARENIRFCKFCNNYTSDSYECDICSNFERRNKSLCVVSSIDDLYKIENSNSFFGTYFVLNGEINYKKKESIEMINVEQLLNLINEFNIKEILLATNMTQNGEITAYYIKNYLKNKKDNLEFYRLASGLPFNSSIDYIDWESLKFSIKNKIKI